MTTMYDGFYGKWDFDWDLIAHLAPDYTKCLGESPLPEDYYMTAQQEKFRDIVIEHAPGPEAVTLPYGRTIRDELSEEDKAVMELMHSAEELKKPTPEPQDPQQPQLDEIRDAAEMEVDEYHEYFPKHSDKHDRIKARSKYRRKWYPGKAHWDVLRSAPLSSPIVPLLPPPKSCLASGSVIRHTDEHFVYEINGHEYLDDHSKVKAYGVMEDETFIKLFTYKFGLNKVFDTSSKDNDGKARLVFNKKTGNLYVITFNKPKDAKKKSRHRRKMSIISLSSQVGYLHMMTHNFRPAQLEIFIDKMIKATIVKIGGLPVVVGFGEMKEAKQIPIIRGYKIEIPERKFDHPGRTILSLLWQYKLGQRIPWITEDLFHQIETLRSTFRNNTNVQKGVPMKKSLFKMLREKLHPSTVIKNLIGPYFNNTTYRLISNWKEGDGRHGYGMVIYSPFEFFNAMQKSKHLHHFIASMLNSKSYHVGRFMGGLNDAVTNVYRRNDGEMDDHMLDKYLRVMKRFHDAGMEAISWHTFKDTFDMAERFRISINTSKLTSPEVIQEYHDRFSRYTQRDRVIAKELRGVEFLPFTHPTKDYKGFTFVFLKNAEELVEEGRIMKHCVGGYGHSCASGNSIIFSMQKDGVRFVTIEIAGYEKGCRITQKYTRHDVTINNPEVLGIIEKWRGDLEALHTNDAYDYESMSTRVREYLAYLDNLANPLNSETIDTSKEEAKVIGSELEKMGLMEYVRKILPAVVPNSDAAPIPQRVPEEQCSAELYLNALQDLRNDIDNDLNAATNAVQEFRTAMGGNNG